MDIKEFKDKLSKAKQSPELTTYYSGEISCSVAYSRQSITVVRHLYCDNCNRSHRDMVIVKFYEPQEKLSLFQASLLYMLYFLNKKPNDYGRYHESPAGQRFINNIEEIEIKYR